MAWYTDMIQVLRQALDVMTDSGVKSVIGDSDVRRLGVVKSIEDDVTVDITDKLARELGNVQVTGSIPEYMWLDGDAEPDPGDDGFTRAMGVEIDPATHEMTVKYYDGTDWQEVV